MNREAELCVALLDESYDRPSWHGPNLRSALRGLSPGEALWTPGEGRNSIWGLILHCGYWTHAVHNRLLGQKERFPRRGRDFPRIPSDPSADALASDIALLDECHQRVRELATTLTAKQLNEPTPGQKRLTRAAILRGLAAHNLYHAGQIRLIRTLHK